MRFARRGFILSIEALMSFVVALTLVFAIGFVRGAQENQYETLYENQLLNDVFEVLERSGASEDIGALAGGDESAGEKAGEKLEEIARYSNRCILVRVEDREMRAGCEKTNSSGGAIFGSRLLTLKNGYKKLEIEMRVSSTR